MTREAWPTPSGGSSREPLPRVEDLPVAEQGYEQASVRAAFDSFYRHAAQLDAALRTLEAVDSFHRQAAALRADLRSLRSAGWTQQPWSASPAYGASMRTPREGVSPAVWRILGEVIFLIAAAVLLGIAKLPWWVIVLVMAAAFLVVAVVEWAASRDRWSSARPAPAAAHQVVEAERAGEETEEGEALGWTAFEEAQEPSDAMTMIGAPHETPAVEEPEPVVEAAADETVEPVEPVVGGDGEPESPPDAKDAGQREPPPGDEVGPTRRHWWQRRGRETMPASTEPEAVQFPRHVRVLAAEEPAADASLDPWEQGFDATHEPDEDTGESEPALTAESEQEPRRRFRRR